MIFHSTRDGAAQFYVATRAELTDPWSIPTLLGPLPRGIRAWMCPCGLEIYYEADRGLGTSTDLYASRRASEDDPFGDERRLDELNSSSFDQDIRLSLDRHHVYFASDRGNSSDIYEASR